MAKDDPGRAVRAINVKKSFGTVRALDGVNLRVDDGQIVSIIGPSGSGKSTFLRCINHLERIDSGTLLVYGEPSGYKREGTVLRELRESAIATQRRDIGMVFQQFNLFQHLSVLENLVLAPRIASRGSKAELVDRAADLLQSVGLLDKITSYPNELSGGQQQRVSIARALMMKPRMLLFDEPTSALDPELVGEVLEVIRALAESGTTMVVVTHEIAFAASISDWVVFMSDGKVVEEDRPDVVLNSPKHERTRSFLRAVL